MGSVQAVTIDHDHARLPALDKGFMYMRAVTTLLQGHRGHFYRSCSHGFSWSRLPANQLTPCHMWRVVAPRPDGFHDIVQHSKHSRHRRQVEANHSTHGPYGSHNSCMAYGMHGAFKALPASQSGCGAHTRGATSQLYRSKVET